MARILPVVRLASPNFALRCGDFTPVLNHTVPTWMDFTKIIDGCCGLGGVTHGAHALGLRTTVAIYFNDQLGTGTSFP